MAWSLAVEIAVQTAILAALDANGAASKVDIYDSGNVLLSTLPFTFPAGVVSGTTGQLALDFGDRDEAAAATGTAAYIQLKTATGVVVEDNIPCEAGSIPVSGKFVMPSLSIVQGAPVEGTSPFLIG
jgi:hypothetical protein